jgi:hypothetical protein
MTKNEKHRHTNPKVGERFTQGKEEKKIVCVCNLQYIKQESARQRGEANLV